MKPVGARWCGRKSLHNVGMSSCSGTRRPFICRATAQAFSTGRLYTWGKWSVVAVKHSGGPLGMKTKTLGYAGVCILVASWMPSLMVRSALPSQDDGRRCPRAHGSGRWTASWVWEQTQGVCPSFHTCYLLPWVHFHAGAFGKVGAVLYAAVPLSNPVWLPRHMGMDSHLLAHGRTNCRCVDSTYASSHHFQQTDISVKEIW